MDIEFHYYISYVLARRANFTPKEVQIPAYSSQYTDDNDCHYYVNHPDWRPFHQRNFPDYEHCDPFEKKAHYLSALSFYSRQSF